MIYASYGSDKTVFDDLLKGHIIHTDSELAEMSNDMISATCYEFRCLCKACESRMRDDFGTGYADFNNLTTLAWLLEHCARYVREAHKRVEKTGISRAWGFIVELCKLNDPEYAAEFYQGKDNNWIYSRMSDMKTYLESEEWERKESTDKYFELVEHWRDAFYQMDHESQHWLLMAWAKNLWPNRIR